MTLHRGSRKHVLDWVEQADFLTGLNRNLEPTGAIVSHADQWMPFGHAEPGEARLESFGPKAIPDFDWATVQDWWLVHKKGANTPNWDLAATCHLAGRVGLVLVEAKAHVSELKTEGKLLEPSASERSEENDRKIGKAIGEAQAALSLVIPGVQITKDSCYQLSNRVAFGWKLASMGLPVVLLYLGFTGDDGIRDVGEPFRDGAHWDSAMESHMGLVLPDGFADREIRCGGSSFWMIVRSLPVLGVSPAAGS